MKIAICILAVSTCFLFLKWLCFFVWACFRFISFQFTNPEHLKQETELNFGVKNKFVLCLCVSHLLFLLDLTYFLCLAADCSYKLEWFKFTKEAHLKVSQVNFWLPLDRQRPLTGLFQANEEQKSKSKIKIVYRSTHPHTMFAL